MTIVRHYSMIVRLRKSQGMNRKDRADYGCGRYETAYIILDWRIEVFRTHLMIDLYEGPGCHGRGDKPLTG